jgi:hypothetical protein
MDHHEQSYCKIKLFRDKVRRQIMGGRGMIRIWDLTFSLSPFLLLGRRTKVQGRCETTSKADGEDQLW